MKADFEAQLEHLPNMSTAQLRAIWRELLEHPAHAKVRRELLIPIIAFGLQERAFGGLKTQTARYLREIAGGSRSSRPCGMRGGARLVRQWQGNLYEVVTLESGFMYDGQKYRSLSEIARAITGTRWSGPVFFGLKKRSGKGAA